MFQLLKVKIKVKSFLFSAVKMCCLISRRALCRGHKPSSCPQVCHHVGRVAVGTGGPGSWALSQWEGQGTWSPAALLLFSGLPATSFYVVAAWASAHLVFVSPWNFNLRSNLFTLTTKFPDAVCISFMLSSILDFEVVLPHAFKQRIQTFILHAVGCEATLTYFSLLSWVSQTCSEFVKCFRVLKY